MPKLTLSKKYLGTTPPVGPVNPIFLIAEMFILVVPVGPVAPV